MTAPVEDIALDLAKTVDVECEIDDCDQQAAWRARFKPCCQANIHLLCHPHSRPFATEDPFTWSCTLCAANVPLLFLGRI